MGVVLFTVLDRQILALLIDPIKQDFHITDTQAALLLGLAFSLSYALAGFPVARLADKHNRRNIVAGALAVWSSATALCGLAQNYTHLFIGRLAVGAGESGYGPATWSIVTDLFRREKVAFGTGMLMLGGMIGTGLALFLGGVVLHFVEHLPATNIPFIGTMRPWQWAFVLVGLPGVLWALLVLTTHEPARRGRMGPAKAVVPISGVFKYMGGEWRAYLATIGGVCTKYLVTLGMNQWMPTMFHREFGWELPKIGMVQGSIALICAPIGMYLGAKLSERWTRQGKLNANLLINFYTLLVICPTAIISPLLPTPELVLVTMTISFFGFSFGVGPSIAAFQLMTPSDIRSQVGAISQLGSNVIAFTLAPLFVALITDYVFRDPQMLKYSMATCASILSPIALLIVWQGLKPYDEAMHRFVSKMERAA
jgi:MFS family permease